MDIEALMSISSNKGFHILDIDMPTNTQPVFDYLAESERTASGKFHGKLVDYRAFIGALTQFIAAANALDRYKKLIFYGEDQAKGRLGDVFSHKLNGYDVTSALSHDNESEIKARYILHGMLGVMTESGEMAEALHNVLTSVEGCKELDLVNLSEEIGDLQWYEAMLARAIGTDFDTIQRTNIAKLRARFPDKFTEANANVRDLEAERKILEQNGVVGLCTGEIGRI